MYTVGIWSNNDCKMCTFITQGIQYELAVNMCQFICKFNFLPPWGWMWKFTLTMKVQVTLVEVMTTMLVWTTSITKDSIAWLSCTRTPDCCMQIRSNLYNPWSILVTSNWICKPFTLLVALATSYGQAHRRVTLVHYDKNFKRKQKPRIYITNSTS